MKLKVLGRVDAERCVTLLMEEPSDYTDWQKKYHERFECRRNSKNFML